MSIQVLSLWVESLLDHSRRNDKWFQLANGKQEKMKRKKEKIIDALKFTSYLFIAQSPVAVAIFVAWFPLSDKGHPFLFIERVLWFMNRISARNGFSSRLTALHSTPPTNYSFPQRRKNNWKCSDESSKALHSSRGSRSVQENLQQVQLMWLSLPMQQHSLTGTVNKSRRCDVDYIVRVYNVWYECSGERDEKFLSILNKRCNVEAACSAVAH